MNTIPRTSESVIDVPAEWDGPKADPLEQMAELMHRLLEDPESEAVLLPQLLRLSVALPEGPARGALESSVAAMARLRGWLHQLQTRQRLSTRFAEVTARLSRVEGLPALMQALADEARMMLDAPLARIDVFAPLVMSADDIGVHAHSGSFIGRWPQHHLRADDPLVIHLIRHGAPLVAADGLPEALRNEIPEAEALIRAEGIQGLLLLPLMLDGVCCGVLLVGDRMMRQWSVMDVDAMKQLAAVAVRAVGRVARSDMAQHTLQMLHERQRALRQQMDRSTSTGHAVDAADMREPTGLLGALLGPAGPQARGAYVDQLIGPLRRADQSRGTALVTTLLTYMDHGHNARAAARVLGVHVNTLHNRLETIEALLPGWSQPGRGLEVHLALRLAASSPAAPVQSQSN